jgi:hypothetical protein
VHGEIAEAVFGEHGHSMLASHCLFHFDGTVEELRTF